MGIASFCRTARDDTIEALFPWDEFTESVSEAELLARPEGFDHLHRVGENFATLRRYMPADAPTTFIKPRWKQLVITPEPRSALLRICALSELKNALRSGDIWVKGSRQFRDDEYLLQAGKFAALKLSARSAPGNQSEQITCSVSHRLAIRAAETDQVRIQDCLLR